MGAREAVREAQERLGVTYANGTPARSGVWGPRTNDAYNSAAPVARAEVDVILAKVGLSVVAINAYQARGGDEAKEAVRRACAEYGRDPSVFLRFAWIESRFNPLASNASCYGLMQFRRSTWRELPGLPPFDGNVYDPYWSTVAAIKLSDVYAKAVRAWLPGVTVDFPVMYLCHQQGAGGYSWLVHKAQGLPLPKTLLKISTASMERAMAANPPPDKGGATKDPAEFLSRWTAWLRNMPLR